MASFNLFRRLLGESDRREASRVQAPGGTRMLVVDDSSTIRAVLAKMLIQDGYTVLKAADGESALDIARDEQPDLIFLDIVLPRMNGFAVLRALRRDERTRHIPIVMISGNLQATEQFYVQRFGADDFMKKPFGRAEVFSRIQALVEAQRLPRREAGSELPGVHSELDNMDHIPDIALPDEDLDEARPAAPSDVVEPETASSDVAPAEQAASAPAAGVAEDAGSRETQGSVAKHADTDVPVPDEAARHPAPATISPAKEHLQTSLWGPADSPVADDSKSG